MGLCGLMSRIEAMARQACANFNESLFGGGSAGAGAGEDTRLSED